MATSLDAGAELPDDDADLPVVDPFGGGAAHDLDPIVAAARLPQRRGRSRLWLWLSLGWLGLVVGAAALADLLPLHPSSAFTDVAPRTPPGLRLPEALGTDHIGRSILSRLVYGARQSLMVSVVTTAIATTVGTLIGLAAGYLRGPVDAAVRLLLDFMLAFPPLVLLLAIAAVAPRTTLTVVVSLSVITIAPFARLVRAKALELAAREMVMAARIMGAGRLRIMFREVLPNVVPTVLSVVFLFMASVMVAEGSLSFLGLGVPPPVPSWGGMVNDGRGVLTTAPHLVFVPSICFVLTILSLRALGARLSARLTGGG